MTTIRLYRVTGTVTDAKSHKAVVNIRVEAWDRESGQAVIFGKAVTDASGQYQITIDESVFGSAAPSKIPDIFLKAFSGSTPLTATGSTVLQGGPALSAETTANLQVDMSQFQPAPKDQLTSAQVLNGIDFFHFSDFKGVFREGRDRTGAANSTLLESARQILSGVNLTPLKPPAVRSRDVINQDPATAQTRLQAQGVTVNQVRRYQPGTDVINSTTTLAAEVKPGDKVDLLEENGMVRGYVIVKPVVPTVSPGDVRQLQSDVQSLQTQVAQVQTSTSDIATLKTKAALVDQLQAQLTTLQQQSAQKDTVIAALQTRLTAVETNVQRLQPQRPG
jgi:hypothetical protein